MMTVYNLTKERLMQHQFYPLDFLWCKELGVVAFQKENTFVFVKLYDEIQVNMDQIIKDVVKVRRNLERSQEVNIWNSYMLACLNALSTSYLELVMKVEKDTTAIRKYIIQQEKDLDRIPFLDNTRSEKVEPGLILDENSFSELGNIQEIVDFIRKYTFEEGGKLTSSKVKKSLEKSYSKELMKNENKKD
ncbi:ABC-three component system middle component 1 [Priestia megaterium]